MIVPDFPAYSINKDCKDLFLQITLIQHLNTILATIFEIVQSMLVFVVLFQMTIMSMHIIACGMKKLLNPLSKCLYSEITRA